jgi:hypothetical protein
MQTLMLSLLSLELHEVWFAINFRARECGFQQAHLGLGDIEGAQALLRTCSRR